MNPVEAAAGDLEEALNGVPGLRAYRDLGDRVDPPGAIIAPPRLLWEAGCAGPTSARFPIYVAVGFNELAVEKLWDLVPTVADAIDQVPDAVVIDASPTVWNANGTDLPAYLVTVEMGL